MAVLENLIYFFLAYCVKRVIGASVAFWIVSIFM